MRVAGYCRVSTDSRQQASSFAAQQRFFREYITRHEGWELGEIYADEGFSGTSTRRREAFNRMIRDARAGKFQLLLTKEVSRFSRNILDTVAYTRELKALGVGVLFLNDGIDTRGPDAELRLSIMASIAQEESRKTSDRVKWGQQRQMERGVVFGHSLLGFRLEHGSLTIESNGAAIVRRIFRAYTIEGKSSTAIARELEAEHIPTTTGGHWSAGQIVRILKNEKYAGDLVQKKTYTPDYLTHQKKTNHGEEEKIILHDHHQPIIDRELWNAAQTQLQARTCRRSTGTSRHYPLSGKIYCGVCGSPFVARNRYRKDGTSVRRWSCAAAARGKCKIGMLLREDTTIELVRCSLESVLWDREQLIMDTITLAAEEVPIQQKNIQQKRQAAIDAYTSGILTADDLRRTLARYETEPQKTTINAEIAQEYLKSVLSLEGGAILRGLVERITVHGNRQVEVKLSHRPQIWTFQL